MKLQKVLSMIALTVGIIGLASTAVSATSVTPITGTASTPISVGGTTPYIISGENSGGNRTCSEVGLAYFNDSNYYASSSTRVNYNGSFDSSFPAGLDITVTDGTYVAFNSTFAIGAAIVKGNNDANIYVYEPQVTSDSGLASPVNNGGQTAGLSNLTFCWNPQACVETVTCSDQCRVEDVILDGVCGEPIVCEANAPEVEECPNECGLPASQVHDGECGYFQCQATQECEVTASPSPTPSPSPEASPSPSPTATPAPSPTSNNDNKKDDNSTPAVGGIVESQGQVLGATTYAETGVVADTLMTLVGFSGAGMTTAGYVMHAKKKNK